MAWHELETLLLVDPPHDFDNQVEEGGLAHQLAAVVGTSGEQVLEPRPPLADRSQDRLGAGAVRGVGAGQVVHQQPAIGVDRDTPFSTQHLLTGIIASDCSVQRLDLLAVEDAAGLVDFPSRPFAIQHQRHVVDGAEQEQPHKPPELPVHRLPCQLR